MEKTRTKMEFLPMEKIIHEKNERTFSCSKLGSKKSLDRDFTVILFSFLGRNYISYLSFFLYLIGGRN